jgi:adenosylhomocysteine nucleosidase
MLGIVVSLPRELKSLTRHAIPEGGWKAISADTLVALSGIGAQRACTAGSVLVAQGATALLSWGYAAALDDRLRPGWLLLPEIIIGADGEIHPVSAEWHRRLYRTLRLKHAVRTDALVESHAIVKTSAEKRALAQRTRAAATDMESAAHARFAQEHRLPFISIRAVTDSASTEIPESVLQALDAHGRLTVAKLLAHACRRPADWPKILRLSVQYNAAQRALKKARDLVLESPPR